MNTKNMQVRKRDGRIVPFDYHRITNAIHNAFANVYADKNDTISEQVTAQVRKKLVAEDATDVVDIEHIQDLVEQVLNTVDSTIARHYISYRDLRTRARNVNSVVNKTITDLIYVDSKDNDAKRENANIDGDSTMGSMLKIGGTVTKEYNLTNLVKPKYTEMHRNGVIHIHDLDFMALCFNCLQIPLGKLLDNGFATGHGYLRTPTTIGSAATLACIIIQANQNDMFGGQAIPTFDHDLAPYVAKSYIRNIVIYLEAHHFGVKCLIREALKEGFIKPLDKYIMKYRTITDDRGKGVLFDTLYQHLVRNGCEPYMFMDENQQKCMLEYAEMCTERDTYQAMEATVHNLCTLASRAGAQVPFSSLNLGTCTSCEGRMVIRNLLLAIEAGLGYGETAIFPISIFKLKKGVSRYPGDPNYDLKQLAIRVTAKRLFPNFINLDAPFNLKYYKAGKPETEATAMGCRTRTIGNVHDPDREQVTGRGNLFFTTINLPYLALEALHCTDEHDELVDVFFKKLEQKLKDVVDFSMDRFNLIAKRKAKNYPFLMGQHLYLDSENLLPDDEVREVIKHGSMTAGFIGLAETLVVLTGKHHGESIEAQHLGLRIVKFMYDYMNKVSAETKLNFGLMGSPAEGCSGRLLRLTRKKFGVVPGVTDKEYFTNSFHVEVAYEISAYDKIMIEAPYHQYCPAGQISYLELDADAVNNLEAMETLIDTMCDSGMGYFAINHPVDRDPVCGYVGYFPNGVCPRCGRREGEGVLASKLLSLKSYSPDPEYDARREISSAKVTLNLVE